jgi:hypothetical protein
MSILLLLLAGGVGLFAHWLKLWAREQTASGFIDYMKAHKRYTIAAVSTLVGSIIGMYVIGDVELTKQTLAMAFMAGFSIDAAVNKAPEQP